MKIHLGLFTVVILVFAAGLFLLPEKASAVCPRNPDQDWPGTCEEKDPPTGNVETGIGTEMKVRAGLSSDGDDKKDVRSAYAFPENAGQVYQLDLAITRNDNPTPGIEFCVNSTSAWGQGYCRTAQQWKSGDNKRDGQWKMVEGGADSLDYTYYSTLVVSLSVDQTFFNDNNVMTEWTMHRREFKDLTQTELKTPTIQVGGTPQFAWNTAGTVMQKTMFMEGPAGISASWSGNEIPADAADPLFWSPPYTFTKPGSYNFTMEVSGPARYGGEAKRTWASPTLTVTGTSPPPPPPPPQGQVNLNFLVNDVCTSTGLFGATVTIDQNFGNGTTRTTDGNGFANFGVDANKNIHWTVSAVNFTTANGDVNSENGKTVNVTLNRGCGGGEPPGAPSATFSANPTSITQGQSSTLSWTTSNATSVSIDQGIGSVTPNTSGSRTVTPANDITYTLTASNGTQSITRTASITVNPPGCTTSNTPSATFSANPTSITQGQSSTLSWTTSNATSVSIDQGIGSVTPNTSGSRTVAPATHTTYTITALNGNCSAQKSASVTVGTPPTGGNITVSNVDIDTGASIYACWTLKRNSPNPNTWPEACGQSFTYTNYPTGNYTIIVNQTGTTHNFVSVAPPNAQDLTSNSSISWTVNWRRKSSTVIVSLTASPNPVNYNGSTVLAWSSTNATSCTAGGTDANWQGTIEISSTSVSEARRTTKPLTAPEAYSVTCSGPGGSDYKSVTVNVNAPPQAGQITFFVSYTPKTEEKGTLNVSCNNPPAGSWNILGLGQRTGPSSSDAASPGSYTIRFDPVSGYNTPGSQTATVTSNNTSNVSCNYSRVGTTGTLNVNSNIPASWVITPGVGTRSGTSSSDQVSPGSYTVNPQSVSGYNTPSAQTVNVSVGNTTSINLNYTQISNVGTLTVNSNIPASWVITPGVGTRSGTSSTDQVSPNTYTVTPQSVSGYQTPSAQSTFVGSNDTDVINLVYSANPGLNTPVITNLDNSVCNSVTVNWSYTNNGVEERFTVWRSTQSGATGTQVSGNLPVSQRSFADTTGTADTSYYYTVKAHTTQAGGSEAISIQRGPVLYLNCTGNLGNSSKTVASINGSPYSSSTVIKNGDVLTFQITINNAGPGNVVINYICDTPSANLTNLRNLQVSGGGSNGGITQSGSCPGGSRLNVSGSKPVGNPNWVITFDATFQSQTADQFEVCSNSATINYTDGGSKTKAVSFGPFLCKTGKGTAPNFREVAP